MSNKRKSESDKFDSLFSIYNYPFHNIEAEKAIASPI